MGWISFAIFAKLDCFSDNRTRFPSSASKQFLHLPSIDSRVVRKTGFPNAIMSARTGPTKFGGRTATIRTVDRGYIA